MDKSSKLDFSQVAPHRRAEIARRIGILESYVAGDMTRRAAVAKLGMTEVSFYNLLRAWRRTGQPGALVGSGKPKNLNSVTDLQRQLVLDAEAGAPTGSLTAVMARAQRLAEIRGVELPGVRTMKVLIGEIRRGRGLRPDGVVDILVTHCAVNVPVRHEEHGIVAPVLSLVLSIRRQPTVLGTALSLSPPNMFSSARALLDALSSADRPRTAAPDEFRVMVGSENDWPSLEEALAGTDLPLIFVQAQPRSWREVTGLIGDRPGGLKLKPDVTGRPASRRIVPVPQGGSPVSLEDADTMVRGRLKTAFGGPRESLLSGEEATRSLESHLRRLIADEAAFADDTQPQLPSKGESAERQKRETGKNKS